MLAQWLYQNVESRPLTSEEIQKAREFCYFGPPINKYFEPTGLDKGAATKASLLKTFDVALYFSQVFLVSYPEVKWGQVFGSKRNLDYGKPLLVNMGKVPLDPVVVLGNLSGQFITKTKPVSRLKELYYIWAEEIPPIESEQKKATINQHGESTS